MTLIEMMGPLYPPAAHTRAPKFMLLWENGVVMTEEKEVGELAPTGQRRKSVVLLVTLDRLSHAHTQTNIIMSLSPRTLK